MDVMEPSDPWVFIDHLPDGMFVLRGTSLIACNRLFAQQIGEADPGALTASDIDQLLMPCAPALAQSVSLQIHSAVSSDDKEFKLACTLRDRSQTTLEIRVSRLIRGDEEFLLCSSRDVSAHEEQLHDLLLINEKLSKSQQIARVASWEWNIDTDELFWSAGIYDMIGYEVGAIKPEFSLFEELIHPDDREAVRTAIRNCVIGGEEFEVEHRLMHSDGNTLWVKVRGNAIRDEQGRATLLLGVANDFTADKLAQEQLRKSEAQFRAVFASSAIGMVMVDPNGRFFYSNPRLQNMLGYSGEELSEMTFADLTHPDDLTLNSTLHHEMVQGQRDSFQIEKRYIHKDGSILWGLVTGSAIRDEYGNTLNAVGMVQDITDRKRMEQERQELHNQLLQAQKMESIGMLTGGIAHDFNNMLASILGHAELLRLTPDRNTPKAENYIEQIFASGSRARDLVSQMLAFSRGSSSNPETLNPESVLAELLKMMNATFPANITLKTRFPRVACQVHCDPVQLHQSVMNLMINARDAMKDSGGTIEVGVKDVVIDELCDSCSKPISGEFIEIYVSDNGAGIGEDTLKRIFDPFFSTKAIGQGSGMGLSVVHGIMHGAGGHILVESKQSGTAFRLLFPKADQRIDEDTQHEPEEAGKAQVIVVDDEAAIAQFLAEFLTLSGYHPRAFTSAAEALDAYRKAPQKYQAVITDQTMPEMTGSELAGAILGSDPGMRVILITGYSEHINEHAALKMGMAGFLEKPIDTRRLLELLEPPSEPTSSAA